MLHLLFHCYFFWLSTSRRSLQKPRGHWAFWLFIDMPAHSLRTSAVSSHFLTLPLRLYRAGFRKQNGRSAGCSHGRIRVESLTSATSFPRFLFAHLSRSSPLVSEQKLDLWLSTISLSRPTAFISCSYTSSMYSCLKQQLTHFVTRNLG